MPRQLRLLKSKEAMIKRLLKGDTSILLLLWLLKGDTPILLLLMQLEMSKSGSKSTGKAGRLQNAASGGALAHLQPRWVLVPEEEGGVEIDVSASRCHVVKGRALRNCTVSE